MNSDKLRRRALVIAGIFDALDERGNASELVAKVLSEAT